MDRVVRSGQLKRIRRDTMIFHEAEPGAGMFVLLSGKVHLCKVNPTGKEQIISVIEPIIMFNELTAIDGGPNPFSALAVKDCLVWNITHDAFHDLVKRYPDPEIGLGLLKVLSARTRILIDRCDDLSFKPVLSRVASLLLDLSDQGTSSIKRSEYPIAELAAHVATVPEVISRSLKSLQDDDLIQYDRASITVLNSDSLAELARYGAIESPL